MTRAPRPHRLPGRPSAELRVVTPDASLEDVLAVVGLRGDREEQRRGTTWVLREDPGPREGLTVAAQRLADRAGALREPLRTLAGRGSSLRVVLHQAPGEGFVVPAALTSEAAHWGGRLEVERFAAVDCDETDPAPAGTVLDAAQVAAHAAGGADLVVGGFGTPEPRVEAAWVLPWRGRVVRAAGFTGGVWHVRFDDRTVLRCRGDLRVSETATVTGPAGGLDLDRARTAGALRRLHVVDSAFVRPGALRLTGNGLRLAGRVTDLTVIGRGFQVTADGAACAVTFHDAQAVEQGWAERDGLTALWAPSTIVEDPGPVLDTDVTDLVLQARAGARPAAAVLADVLADVLRRTGTGPAVDGTAGAVGRGWDELLRGTAGVVTRADDGSVRFTSRPDRVRRVVAALPV